MGLFGKKDFFAMGVKAYQGGNISKAIKNWEKAAEQGNTNALYNMGTCYENGDGIGRDQKKHLNYFLLLHKKDIKRANIRLVYIMQKH